MSTGVARNSDGVWERLSTEEDPPYDITGKYLFFSEDRELLVNVATNELENNGFHRAKVILEGRQRGSEYVLCLYYVDASRKYELERRYRDKPGLKYRYWKSDDDTRSGKYSDEFLQKLSPEEKSIWTKGRQ